MRLNNVFLSSLKWLLILLPTCVLIYLISLYGINTLYIDDFKPLFDLIDIKTSGHVDLSLLIKPVNEHRIFFPKLLIFAISSFTHYNTKAMMIGSAVLICLSYLIIARITAQKKFTQFNFYDCLYTCILGFCLTSVVQYENLFWGFQIAWFLIEFCVVAGLAFITLYLRNNQTKYLIYAVVSGFIASFSSLHGLAVWPCYILTAIIYQLSDKKFDKKLCLYLICGTFVTYCLYFHGYSENAHSLMKMTSSVKHIILFTVNTIGRVLMFHPLVKCLKCNNDTINMTYLFEGTFLTLLAGILILYLIITKKTKENFLPIGLIIFGFAFAFMVGIGRGIQITWGTPSRYTTYSLLVLGGVFAILRPYISLHKFKGQITALLFIALTGLLAYSSVKNAIYLPEFAAYRLTWRDKLLNYQHESLFYLQVLHSSFRDRDSMIKRVKQIEDANLSVFYRRDK